MTQNLFATQQDVLAHLTTQLSPTLVFDTDYPAVGDEPLGENGVMASYAVLRSNDALKLSGAGSFAGARHDEMYTLFDVLCVAHSPEAARSLAYGPGGVADTLVGYKPVDAGELNRAGGGQVFVAVDGTGARPSNFIARVSFRCSVNQSPA
jgi:hypothetical protein